VLELIRKRRRDERDLDSWFRRGEFEILLPMHRIVVEDKPDRLAIIMNPTEARDPSAKHLRHGPIGLGI
jgi:hypothetical protein